MRIESSNRGGLRMALRANASFSGLCAFIAIAAARPLTDLFGLDEAWPLIGLGAVLIAYAAVLALNSVRLDVHSGLVGASVFLDLLWVAVSLTLVAFGDPLLSATGRVVVAVLAAFVGLFGVWQFDGLRRR